jgi:5-formyltetrahydrofolate cyclo-ligase
VLPELLPDRDLRFAGASGPVDEGDIDLMLVPAVAADRSGRRLGRGGGSYDRVLPRVRAFTIAVVHADELLPEVPVEAHDARVDAVLAGARLIRAAF